MGVDQIWTGNLEQLAAWLAEDPRNWLQSKEPAALELYDTVAQDLTAKGLVESTDLRSVALYAYCRTHAEHLEEKDRRGRLEHFSFSASVNSPVKIWRRAAQYCANLIPTITQRKPICWLEFHNLPEAYELNEVGERRARIQFEFVPYLDPGWELPEVEG